MHDPSKLRAMLTEAGQRQGFEAVTYGETRNHPLVALTRHSSNTGKNIYLSSGIHGDEPAPIFAILELLATNAFPRDANLTICPLINPEGLALKTRENADGTDLNRAFKNPAANEARTLSKLIDNLPAFDLSICLHEDWESTGFYLYHLHPSASDIAKRVIQRVAAIAPIDPATEIDGRAATHGIIDPPDLFDPDILEDGWPEAFYLYAKNPHPHFTLETPSAFPIEKRIAMTAAAVKELLQAIPN